MIIGQAFRAEVSLPEGRCNNIIHKAAGGNFSAHFLGFNRRFINLFLTNTGGVNVGFVGQDFTYFKLRKKI